MTEKRITTRREYFLRLREELLHTVGPPTHFTIEEFEAAVKKVRNERRRRESEKRRSREK